MHVLIGGAGAPNFGDELIVKSWIDYLCEQKKSSHSIVFEENIKRNSENFHVLQIKKYPNVKFSDFLVTLSKSRKVDGFWPSVLRGYTFIENKGISLYGKENFDYLLNAETLHLHGGGYLNKNSVEKGFYIGILAAIAKETGAKLFASGIGFLPQQRPEEKICGIVNEIFSLFDVFECRDIESYRFIANIADNPKGLIFGLDDIYLMDFEKYRSQISSQKNLHLSFIFYNVQSFSDELWAKVNTFGDQFDQIYFWESYPWQDQKVFDFLKSRIARIERIPVENLVYNSIPITRNDIVICARFHVHLLGARIGASGYYFKDTSYYDIKHNSIKDRGSAFKEFDSTTDFKYMLIDSAISRLDGLYQRQKLMLANYLYNFD